jgi:hypothetical protein
MVFGSRLHSLAIPQRLHGLLLCQGAKRGGCTFGGGEYSRLRYNTHGWGRWGTEARCGPHLLLNNLIGSQRELKDILQGNAKRLGTLESVLWRLGKGTQYHLLEF